MKDGKRIDENTNYGDIKFLLREKMEEKGISIIEMSNKTGVKYDVIEDYYYNRNYILDSEILAKICYILECSIKDIMMYEKDND